MSEEENDVEVPEDKDALIAQLKANQKWLMLKFDLLHDMLCPDKTGTWQQRVEQVCSACIAVKERGGLDIRATLEKNMAEDIKKGDEMPEGELLDVHAICEQRDAAVQEKDKVIREWGEAQTIFTRRIRELQEEIENYKTSQEEMTKCYQERVDELNTLRRVNELNGASIDAGRVENKRLAEELAAEKEQHRLAVERMNELEHAAFKEMDDSQLEQFGRELWEWIKSQGSDFCGEEISEDILPIAEKAGLCKRVPYDPEKHGEIEADPGCIIWFWGEEETK